MKHRLLLLLCSSLFASTLWAQQSSSPFIKQDTELLKAEIDSLEKLKAEPAKIATLYDSLAIISLDFNYFTPSRIFYNEAIEKKYGLKKRFYYKRKGAFERKLRKRAEFINNDGLDEIADFYLQIGEGFLGADSLHEARRMFQKVVAISEKTQNQEMLYKGRLKLADSYVAMRSWKKAGKTYAQMVPAINKSLPDTAILLNEALRLWCLAEEESSADTPEYLSASNIFAYLGHEWQKGNKAKHDYMAFMAGRGYWNSRRMQDAEYWYSKVITEEQIDSLLANDQFYDVFIGKRFCKGGTALASEFYNYLNDNPNLDYFFYTQLLLNGKGQYENIRPLTYRFRLFDVSEGMERESSPCFPGATFLVEEISTKVNTANRDEFSPIVYNDSLLLFVSDSIPPEPVFTVVTDANGDTLRTEIEDLTSMRLMTKALNLQDYQLMKAKEEAKGFPLISTEAAPQRLLNIPREVLYREGPPVFLNEENNELIFTGNTFDNEGDLEQVGGINTLKLFIGRQNDKTGEWESKPITFSGTNARLFNDPRYSVGHPAVNADRSLLYFSSDAPIGEGNSDIYVADFDAQEGVASDPVNLGLLNSEGNDLFPTLHRMPECDQEVLFFSSNRRDGDASGSLDMYFSTKLEGKAKFTAPQNLQLKTIGYDDDCNGCINSPKDDFGLYLNQEGTAGFFTSDRKGTDDIYRFRIVKMEITVLDDETKEPIPCAKVEMSGPGTESFQNEFQTNEDGLIKAYSFDLNTTYTFKASKPCCVEPEANCSESCYTEICYRRNFKDVTTYISDIPIDGVFRDTIYLKHKPVADLIIVANVKSEQQVFMSFNKDVVEFDKNTVARKGELYEFFRDDWGNFIVNTSTGEQVALTKNSAFSVEGMEAEQRQAALFALLANDYGIRAGNVKVVRNIQYGFAQAQYSSLGESMDNPPKPEEEFNKLAQIMLDHENLLLKVSSHTDSCPPPYMPEYDNLGLSQRRSRAAINSITAEGVDQDRVTPCDFTYEFPVDNENTYGEHNCKNDYNRRTEFKLLYEGRPGFNKDMICDPSMTYSVNRPLPKIQRSKSLLSRDE